VEKAKIVRLRHGPVEELAAEFQADSKHYESFVGLAFIADDPMPILWVSPDADVDTMLLALQKLQFALLQKSYDFSDE
jgi:hypothetical protein